MDFIDRIKELSARIRDLDLEKIETEEATKTAMIMPFINALGYNVFDPTEVVPEFTADLGTKKGEKVDYAIMQDGKPIMLFECKGCKADLAVVHASQLFRYFTVTEVRFAILTNGVVYQFYSDLDKPNRMDEKPFLIIDLLNFDEKLEDELKKFTKSSFDVEDILSTANELKYRREIVNLFALEFKSPSPEFVRHFASKVYSGQLRQTVIEEFTGITKNAFQQFVSDQFDNVIQKVRGISMTDTSEPEVVPEMEGESSIPDDDEAKRTTDFTDEEKEGFLVVKSILREVVDTQRIHHRDTLSYCGILLDDNNRKPICRLHFNRSQKYIGLFDEDKNENRVPLDSLDDIYKFADKLKATVANYHND